MLANHKVENQDGNEIYETHPQTELKARKKRLDSKNTPDNPNMTADFVSKFVDNPVDTRFNRNTLPTIQNAHTLPLNQTVIKDKKPVVPKIMQKDKFQEKLLFMPYKEFTTPKKDDSTR